MILTEILSWKRWGLHGVFEWHENQIIKTSPYFFRGNNNKIHFAGIFSLHFLNGGLAGIAFPFIVSFLFTFLTSTIIVIPVTALLGILYGFILWILTLVPVHKPITSFPPWNHPLGHLPALASLAGHIVYGLALGILTYLLTR